MRIADALVGVTRLGFDTAPIIYFVEAHPQYGARVAPIFQRITDGRLTGVTSIITVTEVLVHPIRRGDTQQARADASPPPNEGRAGVPPNALGAAEAAEPAQE